MAKISYVLVNFIALLNNLWNYLNYRNVEFTKYHVSFGHMLDRAIDLPGKCQINTDIKENTNWTLFLFLMFSDETTEPTQQKWNNYELTLSYDAYRKFRTKTQYFNNNRSLGKLWGKLFTKIRKTGTLTKLSFLAPFYGRCTFVFPVSQICEWLSHKWHFTVRGMTRILRKKHSERAEIFPGWCHMDVHGRPQTEEWLHLFVTKEKQSVSWKCEKLKWLTDYLNLKVNAQVWVEINVSHYSWHAMYCSKQTDWHAKFRSTKCKCVAEFVKHWVWGKIEVLWGEF